MARRRVTVDGFQLVVESHDSHVLVRTLTRHTLHACRAVAEYVEHDVLPVKTWYLSEVIVSADNDRCKGLGSALVKALVDEVRRRGGHTLLVEPGGYGSDPKRLAVFYERLGFKRFSRGHAKFLATNTMVLNVGVPTQHEVPATSGDLSRRDPPTERQEEASRRRVC